MQWFPKLKGKEWVWILGLSVMFLFVASRNLTRLPIFVDESLYLRWAQIAWHDASWRFISLTDGKQPLWMWLVIPFLKIFKDPLVAGRFMNVLCGLVTILASGYGVWLLTGKKSASWWTMLVISVSPFLFFYDRFAVVEAMMIAFGVLVFDGAILLAKTRRLDVALILGMVTGLALLVKSPSLFFLLLIPAAYLIQLRRPKDIFTKETAKYIALVLVGWGIAGVIYNVQRLSPWMHVIADKNSFFVVPYSEIFKDPMRVWNNLLDTFRWHFAYTTIPVFLFGIWGMWLFWRKQPKEMVVAKAWFALPLLGTVLLARLYSPRYMVFTTPYLLMFVGYALSWIKSVRLRIGVFILLSIYPAILMTKLITDPIHFPFVDVDQGYVNGWSAGNGTKQIADWAVARIHETGRPMTIYTEGTFGILPEGLELYTDGRVQGLSIIGIYPINEIPPKVASAHAKTDPETYFILNNTVPKSVPASLELVASYPKLRDNPMRLYHVLPAAK